MSSIAALLLMKSAMSSMQSMLLTLGRVTAMKALRKMISICASVYLWSVLVRCSKNSLLI
jgi:hypothetical protein